MPNRRGRTGAKTERPSSYSPVATSRTGVGVCGRGFPAVAIFDLLFTEVITPEWWSPGFTVRYSSRKNRAGQRTIRHGIEIARTSRSNRRGMDRDWSLELDQAVKRLIPNNQATRS